MNEETPVTAELRMSLWEITKIPQPVFLYEIDQKLTSLYNQAKREYILTKAAALGINPEIVKEQSELIERMREELVRVKDFVTAVQKVQLAVGAVKDSDDEFMLRGTIRIIGNAVADLEQV